MRIILIIIVALVGAVVLMKVIKSKEAKVNSMQPTNQVVEKSQAEQISLKVKKVTLLRDNGGRVDWSKDGKLIAFDSKDDQGIYQIYTMNPDGSNSQCLTCDYVPLRGRYKGNPEFSPDGKWLLFQGRNDSQKGLPLLRDVKASPGIGINNDLWVMSSDGKSYFQLVTVTPETGGVLHPHFSHKGNQIMWSQMTSPLPFPSGTWELKVADFSVVGGTPQIFNTKTYTPGAQLNAVRESHGFSLDDQSIYFSGNIEKGQSYNGGDIFRFDLNTQTLTNLTTTPDLWDEHSNLSPDGTKIVWAHADKPGVVPTSKDDGLDLWVMNPDGSNKYRLTYFNDKSSSYYLGQGVSTGDNAWSPDGKNIVVYVLKGAALESGSIKEKGSIYLIELE